MDPICVIPCRGEWLLEIWLPSKKSIKKLFIREGEILFFQVAMPVNIYSILDYLDYRLLKSRW